MTDSSRKTDTRWCCPDCGAEPAREHDGWCGACGSPLHRASATVYTARRFWVSWYEPEDEREWGLHSPWWVSGLRSSDNASTICAAIIARDENHVRQQVIDAHDAPVEIEWRFIEERPDDWSPFSDRFGRETWMRWPYDPAESQRAEPTIIDDDQTVNLSESDPTPHAEKIRTMCPACNNSGAKCEVCQCPGSGAHCEKCKLPYPPEREGDDCDDCGGCIDLDPKAEKSKTACGVGGDGHFGVCPSCGRGLTLAACPHACPDCDWTCAGPAKTAAPAYTMKFAHNNGGCPNAILEGPGIPDELAGGIEIRLEHAELLVPLLNGAQSTVPSYAALDSRIVERRLTAFADMMRWLNEQPGPCIVCGECEGHHPEAVCGAMWEAARNRLDDDQTAHAYTTPEGE